MASKKELQSRIDALFDYVADIKIAISEHATKLYLHENEIHNNETAHVDNWECICSIERRLTSTNPEIPELKRQIQCGVTGHEFELKEVANFHSPKYKAGEFGLFKCKNCGLVVKRELTKQEIEAAKKLGMVK